MSDLLFIVLISGALAYVLGATPFGYLAGKWKGVDIRQHGSGNIGATNVIRVMGKKIGVPVFILDMLKGLFPVLGARWWALQQGLSPDWPSIAAGFGAVLGHNFTFWLGFKGGKGIATSAGIMLALLPLPLAVGLAVWLLLFFTTRYVAVGSVGSAVAVPTATWLLGASAPLCGFAALIGALAIWRHRGNIQRLTRGEENKFIPKSKRPPIT